jgi:hypothetical protein
VRLSDALVAGGNVLEFALAPDGARVVYRADGRVDGVVELFSVALAGGAAVALDSLPAFADVESFHLAPDSSFVAYRADRETDGVLELYGVPLDGSARPRKLSGPMATGGSVLSDVAALSGGRALYRADQEAVTVFELFEGFLAHALPAPRLP